jgi:hypothetical protein
MPIHHARAAAAGRCFSPSLIADSRYTVKLAHLIGPCSKVGAACIRPPSPAASVRLTSRACRLQYNGRTVEPTAVRRSRALTSGIEDWKAAAVAAYEVEVTELPGAGRTLLQTTAEHLTVEPAAAFAER